MLHYFYAVTLTSVYLVRDRESKTNLNPVAKKIALKGKSWLPVGKKINEPAIAITNQIQGYIPEGGGGSFQRGIENVNTCYWRAHSSDIVALFIQKKDALSCLHKRGLKACDPRWIESTKLVIEKIGDDHPVFEVCKFGGICLAIFEQ